MGMEVQQLPVMHSNILVSTGDILTRRCLDHLNVVWIPVRTNVTQTCKMAVGGSSQVRLESHHPLETTDLNSVVVQVLQCLAVVVIYVCRIRQGECLSSVFGTVSIGLACGELS